MLNKDNLRDLIEKVLRDIEARCKGQKIPFTEEARELLMMVCAHESHLGTYRKQVGGPALGIFQMEPDTFNDLMENYLKYRPELMALVKGRKPEELVEDDVLAITMARLLFFRAPESIGKTPEEWAALAKKRYNTVAGKATAEKYLSDYKKYA